MKLHYKIFIAISLFTASSRAQIQKIRYTAPNNKILDLNRISPAASRQQNRMSLDGPWRFSTDINSLLADKEIQVPGEWTMQGFEVKRAIFAGYKRTFIIPEDWRTRRLKLRFDAVYSEAEIWVNGKKTATHLGGFTPFEIDINNFVDWTGQNELMVKVKSETKADSLANGSMYAVHNLGGISRKVYLMGLAPVNFAYADVKTFLDKNYENATLSADVIIANEQDSKTNNLVLKAELFKADGITKITQKIIQVDKVIRKGDCLQKNLSFDVAKPAKWDPEHPNLYVLKLIILQNGKTEDVVIKNIGFRQVEVRGNQVFVNNMPIKLRGACHHEVMPLRGRSVNGNLWEKDIKLFIEGNVNYIRTSHYPPAEELIDACNRLGMFLEVEAPFCWANRMTPVVQAGTEIYQTLLVDQTMDMINYFRSDPSVIIWSVGNESLMYKEYFKETAKLVKVFDPTRPRNFSQWGPDADDGDLEITNHHYPGPTGPAKYNNYKRPIVFDEYVHLNAYNRQELATDPGIRDAWGIGLEETWENMYKTDAVLGGAIWGGIDDTFFLPNGKAVGYGTWGTLDGWRRKKPEFWHMKKVYSPIKVKLGSNWSNGKITLELENRLLFSNLNECRIEWELSDERGLITADLKRNFRTTVLLEIAKRPAPADKMTIKVYDPRGIMVDIYQFAVMPVINEITPATPSSAQAWSYSQNGNILTARYDKVQVKFNSVSGDVEQVTKNGTTIWDAGTRLMILPLNNRGNGVQMTGEDKEIKPFTNICTKRIVKTIKLDKAKNQLSINVADNYKEAFGNTNYHFLADGKVEVDYKYTLNEDINPRQWGLVFGLPASYQQLDWNRNGMWEYYPADHIGRTIGQAKLRSEVNISGPAGPSAPPALPWGMDRNELGTNDFRSTKMYINNAQLSDGTYIFKVIANGQQHIRAWKDEHGIKALIGGYSNMGSEGFFRAHAQKMDRPLKSGDVIQDHITIELK